MNTIRTPVALPLPVSQRIQVLDIVRGFALLGIFIMNIPGFASSFFAEADGSRLWTDTLNVHAEQLREMLFSGKFNSMFSLLFGIGFTIQLQRLTSSGSTGHGTAIYLRRLAVLLGLGVLHAMVFWTGDVLHVYAVLGFGLLLLRRVPDRVLLLIVVATLLFQPASSLLRLWTMQPETVTLRLAEAQAWEASNNLAYGSGSFADAAREHAREWRYFYDNRWSLLNMLGFYVQMTTTMLIGVLIGRRGWLQRIPELMPALRRLQWGALGVGIACSLAFVIVGETTREPGPSLLKIVVGVCYVLSRLCMTVFYVLTIVRLARQPAWQRRFAPLAAAGRMPLTNYLMQTAIGTALFYGWGLGLGFGNAGQPGPAVLLLLAPAIFFAVQVPLSVWWLRRFERGPLEALWRRLSYRG